MPSTRERSPAVPGGAVLDAVRRDCARTPALAQLPAMPAWIAIATAVGRANAVSFPLAVLRVARHLDDAARTAEPGVARLQALADAHEPPVLEAAVALRAIAARMEDATALELADVMLAGVLAAAPGLPALERGRLLAQRARVARQLGDVDRARDGFDLVARLAREAAAPELHARAAVGRGVLALVRGNLPEADRQFTRAAHVLGECAAASSDGDLRDVALAAHQGCLIVAGKRRDVDAALVHGWQAFELARDAASQGSTLSNIAAALSDARRDADALAAFRAAMRRVLPTRVSLAVLSGAALSAARLGDARTARELTARVAQAADRSDLEWQVAEALITAAEALMLIGDGEEARELGERARSLADRRAFHELSHRASTLVEQQVRDRMRVEQATAPLSRPALVACEALHTLDRREHAAGAFA